MSKDASPRIREHRGARGARADGEPHRTASGVVAESPLVLTDVVTDAGVVGHSMVFTYTPAALAADGRADPQHRARWSKGEPLAPAEIEQKLARRFRLLGTQGLVGMALAAIDMALWDALARGHGLPLVRLLGGVAKPVPAYGAVGYDGARRLRARRPRTGRSAGSPASRPRSAIRRVQRGRRGRPRDAQAPSATAWRSWSTTTSASTPAEADAADARARRRGPDVGRGADARPRLRRPRAGRPRGGDADPVRRELVGRARHAARPRRRASDFVMPDVMKIGGVTGWLRAAALAQAHGLRVSSHLLPEISAQLLCCDADRALARVRRLVEPDPAGAAARSRTAWRVVDDTVGSGVDWNEDAVRRFSA